MNREAPRRTVLVEDTTSNALVTQCDGLSYDWSDQAKDGPLNFVLMAYNSSSFSTSSNSDTEISISLSSILGAYKAGLAFVEAGLGVYKKNEAIFKDDIKIVKLDVMLRDKDITKLRQKFEKAKKERHDLKLTLENFKGSSKNLSRLSTSLYKELYAPKPDLVFADEHVVSESVTSLHDIAKVKLRLLRQNSRMLVCQLLKIRYHQNSKRLSQPHSKRNFVPKAVLTNAGLKTLNTSRHPSSRAAILVNTVRPINTAYPRSTMNGAKPSSNVFHKSHSPVRRTFNQRTTPKNSDLKEIINNAKVNNVTTTGTKVVISDVQGNRENVAKSSACWIWKPTGNAIDHISKDS
nr:hypothetical protein [Tanacetum cinerariifolium]